MTFYQQLQQQTIEEQSYLRQAPMIIRCFENRISVADYTAFLAQAYQHVKHTVPLLMATGGRLSDTYEWLRSAVAEYIEEELGHQEWVLNDLAACGIDKEKVRTSDAAPATELMVAYAYDCIQRRNPLMFFGMVYVLESTSIALADSAASAIQGNLALPNNAFSYLRSHGSLDQEHILFFENLMNKIDDEADQKAIIHSAKMFFRLYGNVFRELDDAKPLPLAA